jgi:hypothetical protein
MPSPSPSPDERLLRCHFVYEIKMLVETYQRCWGEVSNDADDERKIINNALIESFCIHARNLIEFFQDNKFMTSYADSRYKAFDPVSVKDRISSIYKRLSAQISHLVFRGTQNRTIHTLQKIDARDRYEILDILRTEIIEFKRHLAPSYLHVAAIIPVPARASEIPVSMGPFATTTTSNFATSYGFYEP